VLTDELQEERDSLRRELRDVTREVIELRREVHRLMTMLIAAGIPPGGDMP
jgi:vacuolar-type H+-ATPase subunit D/Vma8